MVSIYDYSISDLENYFANMGLKPYKAKQLFKWLYEKRVHDFDEMSDISKKVIAELKNDFSIDLLNIRTSQTSKDGTIKFLFELSDGALIESVLMKFDYGYSACISSQVGCNMGCSFCASGLLKKQRNLNTGEIVLQVLMLQMELDKKDLRLGNIVVMGTGEPFDNYDNLMKALSIVNDPFGLAIGQRHISVSTCGLVPRIRQFANENVQYNLAISLHGSNDELRSRLMPINRKYHLDELIESIRYYLEKTNRRVTFEYLLLAGINDTKENANNNRNVNIGKYATNKLLYINNLRK